MNEATRWRPQDVDVTATGGLSSVVASGPERSTLYTDDSGNGRFVGRPDHPDDYELLGRGLQGGEGITWRARYAGRLPTPVDQFAVKMLTVRAGSDWPTQTDLLRWWDDIHLLYTVRHPHLLAVHDVFGGAPPHSPGTAAPGDVSAAYVLMEWVPGYSLHELVKAGHLSLQQRLTHVRELAEALAVLHSRTQTGGNPMLHRDVKPDNAVVHPQRGLVLVDVGGLRRLDDGYDRRGLHTLAYTPPEVLRDPRAPRDRSSDLFALGGVAYFVVTGSAPKRVDLPSARQEMRETLLDRLTESGVADTALFADRLLRMLDPDPGRRPDNGVLWADGLLALLQPSTGTAHGTTHGAAHGSAAPPLPPPPPAKRRTGLVLAAAGVVALLLVLGAGALAVRALTGGGGGGTDQAAGVVAQDYTGQSAADVAAALSAAGVTVYQEDDAGSTAAAGTITGQSVGAGQQMGTITLRVASGGGGASPVPLATADRAPSGAASPDGAEVLAARTEPGILITRAGRVFDTDPPSQASSNGSADIYRYSGNGDLAVKHQKAPWPSADTPSAAQCAAEIDRRSVTGLLKDVEAGDAYCFTTEEGGLVFARVTQVDDAGVLVDTVIWDAQG